ncbi:MAG: type II secretion system minor pseudopilin GspI [Burkholderiales bacterium]|nr:type II secretion system minor pseudopilin GspI [Burkholderiales bacterium]
MRQNPQNPPPFWHLPLYAFAATRTPAVVRSFYNSPWVCLRRAAPRGFTLLEVLIALAVVAIALGAAVRAVGGVTDHSLEASGRILASWVAQNRLAEHIARRDWPEAGETRGTAEQGARSWLWQETVKETPNPGFRRIEIKVGADGDDEDYVLARLIGYLANPANNPPNIPGSNPQPPNNPGSNSPNNPGNNAPDNPAINPPNNPANPS